MESISLSQLAEICGAGCSIIYSVLLMREKISAWSFGIIASILSIVVFFYSKLYAQAIISIYYAALGVYGWIYWKQAAERQEHVHRWEIKKHFLYLSIFSILGLILYFLFKRYTDAGQPLLDSLLTSFGILASIKEARKILSSWTYWLLINLFSALLYYQQGLIIYAVLMIVYAGICIPGYFSWKKIYLRYPSQQ